MGKLKTHKGIKKVLNERKSGSITIGHPGQRHNTGSKNAAFNRKKHIAEIRVIDVDMTSIVEDMNDKQNSGGALNCLTWTVRTKNIDE